MDIDGLAVWLASAGNKLLPADVVQNRHIGG
jgi:hypothetical protein